jgi:diketogulonate reductase-like aldo/keto reductase
MEAFLKQETPDFVHVNYSLVEPTAEQRVIPLARDRGAAVVINRPFVNGQYFQKVGQRPLPDWAAEFDCTSWAQFSLKYILANRTVTCVFTETTNPTHMEDNIQGGMGRLPDEAMTRRMRDFFQTL